jgi:hypothetical protein
MPIAVTIGLSFIKIVSTIEDRHSFEPEDFLSRVRFRPSKVGQGRARPIAIVSTFSLAPYHREDEILALEIPNCTFFDLYTIINPKYQSNSGLARSDENISRTSHDHASSSIIQNIRAIAPIVQKSTI